MPCSRRRKQSETSACIVCSDDEGSNEPASDLNTEQHESDAEEEGQLSPSVVVDGNDDNDYVSNDNDDDNDDENYKASGEQRPQDSSCEGKEVILNFKGMTRSQQNKSRINTRQNKRGRYTQVADATNSYSMRMMTEIMSAFQDSQREMMQTMLNTTNKNAEDMLSSLIQ